MNEMTNTTAADSAADTPVVELRQVSKRFGEQKPGIGGRLLQSLGLKSPTR